MFQVVRCYPFTEVDPYFANTVLLLSGDGTNGQTTFADESFKARGTYDSSGVGGNAISVTTAFKKFGTGSAVLDGNNDRVQFADSADWHLSGDFTIEGWFSFSSANIGVSTQAMVAQWETGSNRSWILQLTSSALQFSISTNGTASAGAPFPLSYTWTPTADTFYHIAVDRSGNTWRLYIDGTMVDSETSSSTPFNATALLTVGLSVRLDGAAFTSEMAGNFDEVRITKGVARYASDSGYSVPTAAFPRS